MPGQPEGSSPSLDLGLTTGPIPKPDQGPAGVFLLFQEFMMPPLWACQMVEDKSCPPPPYKNGERKGLVGH